MNVDTKLMQKKPAGSRMSNETFITLFMIGMLVLVFAVAVIAVPNFYLPQNMLNLLVEQLVYRHHRDRGHVSAGHRQLRHVGRRRHRIDRRALGVLQPGR